MYQVTDNLPSRVTCVVPQNVGVCLEEPPSFWVLGSLPRVIENVGNCISRVVIQPHDRAQRV